MSLLRAFGSFWWDLVIGDDPKIAAYVVGVLVVLVAVTAATGVPDGAAAVGATVLLVACFVLGVGADARRVRRTRSRRG